MLQKWISSEKANRQTQIQGCFWLAFPLLFWVWQKERQQPGLSILLRGCSLCMSNNNEEKRRTDRVVIGGLCQKIT